jgi:exopolyphosphatase/guanosine-5'-triphosphate,3'-diphosphate pyrophosphatase
MKYAAIDIGSNAVRLLIARVHTVPQLRVEKLGLIRVPVRLGESVFSFGSVSEEKKLMLAKTMRAFRLLMEIHEVQHFRACATSAMREARNAKVVMEFVKAEANIDINIIEGQEEAQLIQAALSTVNLSKTKSYLFVDVGGGSTELSLIRNGKLVKSKSFEIGTVRLLQGQVKTHVWEDILAWTQKHINKEKNVVAVGSGGNINKLLKLSATPRDAKEMSIEQLDDIIEVLDNKSIEERMQDFSLREDRADVIVPAGQIYQRVMHKGDIELIEVPKIGVADGIVLALNEKFGQ